jgi:ribosome-binding factor A
MPKRKNNNAIPGQRQLRVGEEVRHVLSELFTRGEVHDKALSGRAITISEVRMSPDLRHATCFVMPLGGEDIDEVLVGLKRAAPFLRGEVGRRIRLRLVPELSFKADMGFDHAQRIDALLKGTDDV